MTAFVRVTVSGGTVSRADFAANVMRGVQAAAQRDMVPRIKADTPVRTGRARDSVEAQRRGRKVNVGYQSSAPYARYVPRARAALSSVSRKRSRSVAKAGLAFALARSNARRTT